MEKNEEVKEHEVLPESEVVPVDPSPEAPVPDPEFVPVGDAAPAAPRPRKKRGRPAGGRSTSAKKRAEQEEAARIAARAEATGIISLLDTIKGGIGGAEGVDSSQELREPLLNVTAQMCLEEGVSVPAKYFFVPMALLYVTAAMRTPTAAERFGGFFGKVKSFWSRRKKWGRRKK